MARLHEGAAHDTVYVHVELLVRLRRLEVLFVATVIGGDGGDVGSAPGRGPTLFQSENKM